MAILSLNEVWKTYEIGEEKVNAMAGINLNVNKGDFITIMGPSGSGKSTTMNMIGCLDVPSSGAVLLENQDISHLEESDLAMIRGKKIGFIFQKFNLIPTLTALENVELPMMFQEIPKEIRKERAAKLLSMVGLAGRLDHRPNELSGGEQQRVAIARALSNDPEIIVADEPTGNLDSKTGVNVMDFLRQLNKQGKTIIIVTHNPELTKYSNKSYMLRDGKIQNEN
ncbi:MAG: ABC transporter ATP-binding protein [Candidatus Nanoarchaeia archaeon]